MDARHFLDSNEVLAVQRDLDRRRKWLNTRQNAAVFALSCGCGLRSKEIRLLNVGDLIVTGSHPVLRVRKEATKGRAGHRKARTVPLDLDAWTLKTLASWLAERKGMGAKPEDPFVCTLFWKHRGYRLARSLVSSRWFDAIKNLPPERRRLSIHCGRHTFGSFVFHKYGVLTARDLLGHASIATTSIYAHVLLLQQRDGRLFQMEEAKCQPDLLSQQATGLSLR